MIGSLNVAVLAADLALLQTIGRVFKLCIDTFWVRRHPKMKYCEGCLQVEKRARQAEEMPRNPAEVSGLKFRGAYSQVEQVVA